MLVTMPEFVTTAVIWIGSAAVPVALFAGNLSVEADVSAFVRLYGRDLANTVDAPASKPESEAELRALGYLR